MIFAKGVDSGSEEGKDCNKGWEKTGIRNHKVFKKGMIGKENAGKVIRRGVVNRPGDVYFKVSHGLKK